MMSACVMNQPKGHWLLSNALNINLSVTMAYMSRIPLVDGGETFDQFDIDLHLLRKNMWQEVVKVIRPFQQFLKSFDFLSSSQ
jgi:hypothetical protein